MKSARDLSGTGLSVLVFTRNASISDGVERMLNEEPHRQVDLSVRDTFDGALSGNTGNLPDLIVADLSSMDSPLNGGLERLRHDFQGVPILAVCDHNARSHALQAVSSGLADEYLLERQLSETLALRMVQDLIADHAGAHTAGQMSLHEKWDVVGNVLEDLGDGVLIVDHDGVVRYLNSAAESIFCRDREQLTGSLFGYPIVSNRVTEIEILQNTRKVIVAEMRASSIVWKDQKCALVSIRDATDRKEMEERLRSELRLASTLAELYVPLVDPASKFSDLAHAVLEKSRAITRSAHGYVGEIDPKSGNLVSHTLTDMVGRECSVLRDEGVVFPCGPDQTYHALWGRSLNVRKPLCTNSPESHPASTGLPEGHVPIERFLSVPVLIGNDLVGQIALANPPEDYSDQDLHAIQRISDFLALSIQRKRFERALKQSEERFKQIADNIQDVFWSMEPETGRYAYVSPGYEKIWGKDREELYADSTAWMEPIVPDDREKVRDSFALFLEEGIPYEVEYRIVRPDGALRWIWDRAVAIRDDKGMTEGVAGLAQDITRRKMDQLRQKDLMDEIREFAYIVSHDLRAPLTNIKGFSGELELGLENLRRILKDVPDALPEERRSEVALVLDNELPESISFIKASVTRMDHLIGAMLSLSRLGRKELAQELVDVGALVQSILDSSAHQISHKGITVSVESLPPVLCDLASLQHIFGNLLDNAIKYLDPRRPGVIKISGWSNQDHCFYQIRDNGVGIKKEDHETIFRIFRRSGDHSIPGEGMGLAYARTIVRRHGGSVWCESEPGVGSTFTFSVIRCPEPSGPADAVNAQGFERG